MQLLITSGIRRGECIGLKWKDINEQTGTITIARSVVYMPESGIIVSTPKTVDSVRTILIMQSTLKLLQQLKRQTQAQHRNMILKETFVFPGEKGLFTPCDPRVCFKTIKVTKQGYKRYRQQHKNRELSSHI